MFSSLPLSWKAVNSGGSRKRLVFNPFAARKLPHLGPPTAILKSAFTVPNEPYEVVKLPVGCITPKPERVVALITRLVLSPNSAGGAPEISSRDWTESVGIGLWKKC